jgi:hypothetical protein
MKVFSAILRFILLTVVFLLLVFHKCFSFRSGLKKKIFLSFSDSWFFWFFWLLRYDEKDKQFQLKIMILWFSFLLIKLKTKTIVILKIANQNFASKLSGVFFGKMNEFFISFSAGFHYFVFLETKFNPFLLNYFIYLRKC